MKNIQVCQPVKEIGFNPQTFFFRLYSTFLFCTVRYLRFIFVIHKKNCVTVTRRSQCSFLQIRVHTVRIGQFVEYVAFPSSHTHVLLYDYIKKFITSLRVCQSAWQVFVCIRDDFLPPRRCRVAILLLDCCICVTVLFDLLREYATNVLKVIGRIRRKNRFQTTKS